MRISHLGAGVDISMAQGSGSRNLCGPVLHRSNSLAAAKTLITDPALSLRFYAFYCDYSSSLFSNNRLPDFRSVLFPPTRVVLVSRQKLYPLFIFQSTQKSLKSSTAVSTEADTTLL
jgi:hypothetical protein